MSKPIFIIRVVPDRYSSIMDIFKKIEHSITKEYNILVVSDNSVGDENLKFECYNSPHTEIEFEELKKQVLELCQ